MASRHPLTRVVAAWGICVGLLVLAVPLGLRVTAGATACRFLAEFLTEGSRPWLSASTHAPPRESVTLVSGGTAHLWRPRGRPPHPGLVLVHGLTPEGKNDPRLAWAAGLLARAGFVVMVPDLPAMRTQRLRPDDAVAVAAAVRRLAADPAVHGYGLVMLAISVGAAPALGAAADSEIDARVRLFVSLGGYGDARELVRYFTTGAYTFREVSGRVHFDPALARAYLALNLDLVHDPSDREAVRAALAGLPLPATAGPEARAVLAVLSNRDPARVDTLLAALPPATQALLDALSPARRARRLSARLLVLHGREDQAVPFTESLRLAAAADPRRTRVMLVSLVGHVEGLTPAWQQVWEFARLWGAAYEIFRG